MSANSESKMKTQETPYSTKFQFFFSIFAAFLRSAKKINRPPPPPPKKRKVPTNISTGEIIHTKIACRIFLVPYTENVQKQNDEIALGTLQAP